jgi:hypothetical protein
MYNKPPKGGSLREHLKGRRPREGVSGNVLKPAAEGRNLPGTSGSLL